MAEEKQLEVTGFKGVAGDDDGASIRLNLKRLQEEPVKLLLSRELGYQLALALLTACSAAAREPPRDPEVVELEVDRTDLRVTERRSCVLLEPDVEAVARPEWPLLLSAAASRELAANLMRAASAVESVEGAKIGVVVL